MALRFASVAAWLAIALAASACVGETGGRAFEFEASAAGPEGTGGPLVFATPRGYDVELTTATIRVGAVYMNELLPVGNAEADDCLSSGRYTAQITRGRDVNLLDARPQKFPLPGLATNTLARAGEVWLTGGDIYDENDATPVLELAGTARRSGAAWPFRARITIAQNRKRPPPTPAQPGANPLCRERIVAPIPIAITPQPGGALTLRIDPRKLFLTTEFSELKRFADDPPIYGFEDDASDAASIALFAALRSAPLYDFRWQ